jgi:hypothetical protein
MTNQRSNKDNSTWTFEGEASILNDDGESCKKSRMISFLLLHNVEKRLIIDVALKKYSMNA